MRSFSRLLSGVAVAAVIPFLLFGCVDSANLPDSANSNGTPSDGSATQSRSILDALSSLVGGSATSSNGPGAAGSPNPDPLQLTADQQAQAQAIIDQYRSDVRTLSSATRVEIRAVFTDAQRTTLDIIRRPIALPFADLAIPADNSGFDSIDPRMGSIALDDAGELHAGMMGVETADASNDPSGEPNLHGDGSFSAQLIAALGLTADQQAGITTAGTNLQTALIARREQVRTDLRAILTDAQRSALDAVFTRQPGQFARAEMRGMGHADESGDELDGFDAVGSSVRGPWGLDLTAEQRTQAIAIAKSLRTDAEALITAGRAVVHAALTADQLTIIDGLVVVDPAHVRRNHPPIYRLTLPVGLTDSLNITTDQATTIDGEVTSLHTSLHTRRDQAHTDFRAILTADQITLILERQVVRLAAPAAE